MNFTDHLLTGRLIKRYKRFFVDIIHNNKKLTVHCPNSGSMMGLLNEGSKVWISRSNNPKRKLKHTLELIEIDNQLIGVNTFNTNKIVFEALKEKKISYLEKFNEIKTEVSFNKNNRFDFLILNDKQKCFVEVKNVTLQRKNGVAEFPDAITARGTKHLKALMEAKKNNYDSCILYLIQRENCRFFKIAGDIDAVYKSTFNEAKKAGIKILCYDCKITTKKIKLNKEINIIN